MRLATILFRKMRIPGYIYGGKHRKIPKVTALETGNASKRLQLEEQNMFYLRHPYLTLEQSWGHAAALGKRRDFIREKYLAQQKFNPDVTVEERFEMLMKADRWD